MKQPRVPEYREADGVSRYIKLLILFLKDFSMSVWTANNQRKKELYGGVHHFGGNQTGQDQKRVHCQKNKGKRRLGVKLFQSVSLLFR